MSDLISRVTKVLDSLLNSGESFTFLDVSNAVKQDGGPFVSHSEVKDVAKPIVEMLVVGRGYTSTLITVEAKGSYATANLYHLDSVDPNTYTKRSQAAHAPACTAKQTATAPAAQAKPKHIVNAKASKTVKVRKDGGIEIPAKILEEAGLWSGADVVLHPNSLSLVDGSERQIGYGTRISAKTLAQCNLSGKKELTVCAFSDKVVISG